MKRLLMLVMMFALARAAESTAPPSAADIAKQLAATSAEERQQATTSLMERYVANPDAVLTTLFTLEGTATPEIRTRSSETIRMIFDRFELGIGTCGLGVVWSWHLDTRNGQLIAQIRVRSVEENGPAATAGLRAEDLIVLVDGNPLEGDNALQELRNRIALLEPGKTFPLEIRRNGKTLDVSLKAGPASAAPNRKTHAGHFDEWTAEQRDRLGVKKPG